MEEFVKEHAGLVIPLFSGLFSMFVLLLTGVVKASLKSLREGQKALEGRLDDTWDDLAGVQRDIADGKRDRLGIHDDIKSGFESLMRLMESYNKANAESHEALKQLIIRNGNGHA